MQSKKNQIDANNIHLLFYIARLIYSTDAPPIKEDLRYFH